MFFINLDSTYKQRFDMGKFMEFANSTHDVLTSYMVFKLKSLPEGGKYTVSVEEQRLDLLSFKIYGDSQYWWILMFYNSIFDISDVVSGLVLRYPTLTALEDLFFSLRSREAQQV